MTHLFNGTLDTVYTKIDAFVDIQNSPLFRHDMVVEFNVEVHTKVNLQY